MKNFKAIAPRLRREFQGIVTGVNLGKTRRHILAFTKDFKKPYWERIKEIESADGYKSPRLSDLVPPEFRYLYRSNDLRNTANFLAELRKEKSDFDKEDNLKIAINFYGFYLMFLSRVAENMCLASSHMDSYSLEMIGLSKRVMQYYKPFGVLRNYTVDEWKKASFTSAEVQYLNTAFSRLFKIFGN